MSSAFVPQSQRWNVEGGYTIPQKRTLPTTPRQFFGGTPMFFQGNAVEPALMLAGHTISTDLPTTVELQNAIFAPLFCGVSRGGRVAQQLQAAYLYGQPSASGGGPVSGVITSDASTPFITVDPEGIATAYFPSGAAGFGSAHYPGELVDLFGFTNEATYGFYDNSGTRIADTKVYLYNDQVQITTTAANAIGVLWEDAPANQTYVRFKFKAVYGASY